MNLKIRTKKMPSSKWVCFTTYKGIDKAFIGKDISVVAEMTEWLKGEHINVIWIDPVIHERKSKSNYRFRRPKIDNEMV